MYKATKWDPKIQHKHQSPFVFRNRECPFTLSEIRGVNADKQIEKMLKVRASDAKLKVGQTSLGTLSISMMTDSKASEISPSQNLKHMPSTSL